MDVSILDRLLGEVLFPLRVSLRTYCHGIIEHVLPRLHMGAQVLHSLATGLAHKGARAAHTSRANNDYLGQQSMAENERLTEDNDGTSS